MIQRFASRSLAVFVALAVVGCAGPQGGDHGHGHGGDHGHGASGGHGHGHDEDGGHGHPHADHHAPAPPEPPDQEVTQVGAATELFVEFPALVAGREWPFAVHLTRLAGFRPVPAGQVTVTLSGGGAPEETFTQAGPERPGYFRVVVKPAHRGLRTLTLSLTSEGLSDRHDLGPFPVYASVDEARRAEPEVEEDHGDEITFSKEQQWTLDFGLGEVEVRRLRPTLEALGTLRARDHGEAWVRAPQEGRLLTPREAAPSLGDFVTRDQVLAVLALPFHEGADDPATLELAVTRSRVELEAAALELSRLTGLLAQGAVPARRVTEAQSRKTKAEAELGAARRRLERFQAQQRSEGEGAAGRVELRAPIAGTVVETRVVPGVFVDPGDELVHLVDLDRLWLEVHVPASRAHLVNDSPGAWFEVEGWERLFEVTEATGGRRVLVGGVVDPRTRTVPLIFELPNPDRVLKVGQFAQVRVLTEAPRQAVAVPRSALVEEAGKTVAYVQLGGETFQRRVLRVGIRDGDWVEVLEGLEEGEVVVTTGAYFVRLAGAGDEAPSHGHAH